MAAGLRPDGGKRVLLAATRAGAATGVGAALSARLVFSV